MMISKDAMQRAVYETIVKSSCEISPDIQAAFERAIQKETSPMPKRALETTLQSMKKSKEIGNPLCPDTGWPLFFCKVGNEAEIEGGLLGFEEVAKLMVAKATKEGYLRSTMKHPLTGDDPGTNVGPNMPGFYYRIVEGNSFQITFVAKGGGSECFGGTRFKVVAYADGVTGVKKSVVDWYIAAARAGAICPPSVLGIGIGGTADIAARLAKEASTLRLVGSRHPEPIISGLEEELTTALNNLGIGPMGSGGNVSVYAVHIEYSLSHLAGITLAMSANCWVARRATTVIHADSQTEDSDNPRWFDGR
jgi:tartrate/fumarate subfamily iron-sulfur-dependent hydro-lyase alpha chain